jgi:hypothetical protein
LSKYWFLAILLGTILVDGHHFGGDYANDIWKIWIHILAATWQVTNQNAKQSTRVVSMVRPMKLDY